MDPALHLLNSIPWSTLHHAYGPATDVPNQLLALQSPNKQTRSDACDQLYSNIYHQSDRYEATAYAVSYLLKILENPATPDRPRLFCLLLDLALGDPADELPLGVKDAPRVSEWTCRQEVDYGAVAYEAVRAGVPLFWRCLEDTTTTTGTTSTTSRDDDDDAEVRAWAACALAYFPGEVSRSVNRLLQLMDQETESIVLASITITLGLLAPEAASTPSTLLSRLNAYSTNPHPLIQWAAAVALIRLQHHRPEHVNVITHALTEPAFIPAQFHYVFPFCDGDFRKYSGKILRGLDMGEYPGVMPAVLGALPRLPCADALDLTEVVMELAFGGRPGEEVDDDDDEDDDEEDDDDDDDGASTKQLSELQLQTMKALAEWDGAWETGTVSGIIQEWDIPVTCREECRRYIELPTGLASGE